MSKGSAPRPCDRKRFDKNFGTVFGPEKIGVGWKIIHAFECTEDDPDENPTPTDKSN